MASRRTRIKGIANIPQRRKNVGEDTNDNLTNNQADKEVVEPLPLPEPVTKSDVSPQLSKELDVTENVGNSSERPNEVKEDIVPAKPVVKRRTFIKPSVSASAINRKPKQALEKLDTETIVEKIVLESTEKTQQTLVDDLKEKQTSKQVCSLDGEVTLDEVHLTSQNLALDLDTSPDKGVRRVLPHPSTPSSDTEYPPPPPSPSKINRSRIKAIPRLGYRKTSFSASESEDESKRNYNRNRNDSVCSTASNAPESIADCLSPQRPKDIAAASPKKCNRTEQSRKLAEARREFQRRFGTNKPDRQRLTMIDLIFYNPTTNPMTNDATAKQPEEIEPNTEEIEQETPDDAPSKSDEENEIPAPQIKISASGEIIIDEQSLLIENKEVKRQQEELQRTKLVDGDHETGYGIYKRQRRAKEWTSSETLRFYKALNTIGTDFTLMCELFPRRTRRELKQKFKKEERINKGLIDKAVMQPCSFDYVELKHEVDMEEKEMEELRVQKEREAKMRQEKIEERQARKRKAMEKVEAAQTVEKPAPEPAPQPKPAKQRKIRKPRSKKLNIESVLEDSDADVSDIATQSESEGEQELLTTLKPTRSGRVPKTTKKFDTTQPETTTTKTTTENESIEPGSIMIITEAGANGEPVHKIYMVTSDSNSTPLNVNTGAGSESIQVKKGVSAKNIMTISTNVTDDEAENHSEENNVTVPAHEDLTTLKTVNNDRYDRPNPGNSTRELQVLKVRDVELK